MWAEVGVEINEPWFSPTVEIEREEKTRRGQARLLWSPHIRGWPITTRQMVTVEDHQFQVGLCFLHFSSYTILYFIHTM
jgi:hypothetical protein